MIKNVNQEAIKIIHIPNIDTVKYKKTNTGSRHAGCDTAELGNTSVPFSTMDRSFG